MTMFTDYLQKENWLLGSLLRTLEWQHFELLRGRPIATSEFSRILNTLQSEHEIHCRKVEQVLFPALGGDLESRLTDAHRGHQGVRSLLAEIIKDYTNPREEVLHAEPRLGFLLANVLRVLETELAQDSAIIQTAETILDAQTQARLLKSVRGIPTPACSLA